MKLEAIRALIEAAPEGPWYGDMLAQKSLDFINCARSEMPKLLAVAEAADALAVVLGDRVHNHLTANERHWHNELANRLTALEAE